MADIEISPLVETWRIANLKNYDIALVDVPGLHIFGVLQPLDASGNPQWINALDYTTADLLAASDTFRNALISSPPLVGTEGYKHTHEGLYDTVAAGVSMPDATTWHSHSGLSVLTAGAISDADALHTHDSFSTTTEINTLISAAIDGIDLSSYVVSSGSINQLSDITSTGETVEAAISLAHAQGHTLLEHLDDDPITMANVLKLFDGSNADCCHTHSNLGGGTFDGEHNDLDGLNEGDYLHITAAEYVDFGTLTDGSNADDLHTHSGLVLDHNIMDGLQGGSGVTNPSLSEYYHLDYEQYIALVDREHNDLNGIQGGAIGKYYHLTEDENNLVGRLGEDSSGLTFDELPVDTGATSAYELPLGLACDGDWTDGLFSWNTATITSCAIDDINEVLASLAPPPAPALDDVDVDTGGTTADLSFDASNPIGEGTYIGVTGIGSRPAATIDNAFTNSGDRVGVINASTDIDGTLNEDVPIDTGTPNESYPANAFGDANLGILILELNGVEFDGVNVRATIGGTSNDTTIDLTNASAQDTTISDTSTGIDVIAATSVSFPGGDSFDQFKYRTGTYHVESGDMRLGWNYMRIIHRTTSDITTNYVDWVADGNVVDTTYSSPVLDNLIMTGSSYLSGVRYHTDGTADYDIDIDNAFRNTYVIGNAITFSCTNGAIGSQSLGNSSGNELLQVVITNASFNVSGGRKLDASIISATRVNRTFNSNESNDPGGSDNIPGLLMDDQIAGASGESDTSESFNAEGYRQESTAGSFSLTNTASYASGTGNGPAPWTNTESLVGVNAGHNDGLLEYNGALRYPTQGVNSGDFRNTGDGGPGCEEGYAGNPDYSGASGDRVYLRYFYVGSGKQNFTFTMAGSEPTAFVSVVTGVSGNNLTMELLAPNTTTDGASIVFKDCTVDYLNDNSVGCYTSGTKDIGTSNWICTIGTKSTSSSGSSIVIRITASASWTGNISSLSVAV